MGHMSLTSEVLQAVLAERKRRWLDLYDPGAPDRCLYLIRCEDKFTERPWPRLDNTWARVAWAWQKYQMQLEQLEWLADDSLPYLDVYTGTEIFAAAFGCPVYYPENDMPFAVPLVRSAEEADEISMPDLQVPVIAQLFEIADELRRRAEPDALMHMVDLQSPMDIAALIWDKTSFYPALIQNPQAVQRLTHKVQAFMIHFLDTWFERYGQAFIAHYPDYYMPYGITLSEDEIGAVSGKMFNNLFLPELVQLSERYGAFGMHCCAHARHQWSQFEKIPNLKMLNLVQPLEVLREANQFFAGKVALWPSLGGEGPAWTWPGQVPAAARVVFEIYVENREEAEETAGRMRAALGR